MLQHIYILIILAKKSEQKQNTNNNYILRKHQYSQTIAFEVTALLHNNKHLL